MARTTHELWLEDRQGVIDRDRDRVWWRCLHWCSSVGLLLAVVEWGWVVPSAIVLASVAISVLLFVACLGIAVWQLRPGLRVRTVEGPCPHCGQAQRYWLGLNVGPMKFPRETSCENCAKALTISGATA